MATAFTYSLAVIVVLAAINGITPFGMAGTMLAITTINCGLVPLSFSISHWLVLLIDTSLMRSLPILLAKMKMSQLESTNPK